MLFLFGILCCNTSAWMHRYMYSIFDILFQMLSDSDSTGNAGPGRDPALRRDEKSPKPAPLFFRWGLPPTCMGGGGTSPPLAGPDPKPLMYKKASRFGHNIGISREHRTLSVHLLHNPSFWVWGYPCPSDRFSIKPHPCLQKIRRRAFPVVKGDRNPCPTSGIPIGFSAGGSRGNKGHGI